MSVDGALNVQDLSLAAVNRVSLEIDSSADFVLDGFIGAASPGDSLREAFGRALTELGDTYTDFLVLDADIAGGTGTHHFRKSHPERFIQCGIQEQNMVANTGKPVEAMPAAIATMFCS